VTLSPQQIDPSQTPAIVLTQGYWGTSSAKVATGLARFGKWPLVAILDRNAAPGMATVLNDATPGGTCPIVGTLEDALTLGGLAPKALILGTAPRGGALPDAWTPIIEAAIRAGLHVVSGLHDFLTDRPHWVALAEQHQVALWDVRDPQHSLQPHWWPMTRYVERPGNVRVVTMVGSDCSVGKMFTALTLDREAQAQGMASQFVATGQTGILIEGWGVPLDRVIGDFMAGYTESAVMDAVAKLQASRRWSDNQPQTVFVEGQGALRHPAYSGVTLSLLHGSHPDGLILCHTPGLTHIKGDFPQAIAPLADLVRLYEQAASWIRLPHERPCRVLGISLNTAALSAPDAQAAVAEAQRQTGLPATDPVRVGVAPLLQAIQGL
jgi:uncharacterized NAD-dependent epimerase/dehydratase family protein